MPIYFNETKSKVVEFGSGDIGVALVDYKGKTKGVAFYPLKNPILPIGTDYKTPKGISDENDILFYFNKIESIDVVIGKLEELKAELIKED
jgi:hypothetical protein